MLVWIIPMSVEAGHLTAGSAGRLNYCWYIDACDSRSPDTHQGEHTAYHQVDLDATHRVVWAEFEHSDRWTYAPWSDPTAWEEGVLTRHSGPPAAWQLVSFWGRQTWNSFALWLLPLLLAVLVPWVLLEWPPGAGGRLWGDDRSILVTALLGLAGIGQFILIHAEPRLIAPYALLLALAVLSLGREDGGPSALPVSVRRGMPICALLVTAVFAFFRLRDGFETSPRIEHSIEAMAATNATLAQAGLSQERIVVVGAALPVESSAFLAGARIVAQVLPSSGASFMDRSPDDQHALLTRLFGGKAQIAWLTTPEGEVRVMVIP
jgi:hypothetical protein